MKPRIKFLILGIIIGAVLAFPLGINFGRDDPLLSNPFAKSSIKYKVKKTAKDVFDDAKKKIHKATESTEK